MSAYTIKNLRETEDAAPAPGGEIRDVGPMDAIRIAPNVVRGFGAGADGLEYLAFGARHDVDGETVDAGESWG